MAAARVILVELWPRRPADGVAVPLRVIGGAATRADHLGVQWQPALVRFPRMATRLGFNGRAFGTGAVSTVGDIAIAMGSPAITPFAGYLWSRALVTIRTGPADGADGAFTTLWTGRAADMAVRGKQMIVRLADPAEDLRRSVLPNQFAGNGDLEGPADLKGRMKPRAWGATENVPAILIDPSYGIYLLVEGQASVDQVKDGGVAFGAGPTAADLTALRALSVPAGTVATSSSDEATLVRPWTRPTFTMTADITAGVLSKPAEIAQAIVTSRSAVPFAAGQVAAYDTAQPGPIGIYVDDERTLVDELDRIFAGLGSWWKLNAAGEIEVGQFEFGNSAMSFEREVVDIARQSVLTPTRRRLVGYRRNFRPMNDAEVAGSLKTFNWRGAWSAGIAYAPNDGVEFGGASYLAVAGTAAGESPASAPAKWSLLAAGGADGAQGPQGPQGATGPAGLNNASVFIYQRAAAAPALPSASTTYTFSTKVLTGLDNGWTQSVPAGSDPLWVSAATASSAASTDAIAAGEWAAPTILAKDGAAGPQGPQGASGPAGLNNASVFIYKRSASTPALPSASTTYTFATKSLAGLDNGWTQAVPAGSDPLWVSAATASSAASTDAIAAGEWAAPTILAKDGAAGPAGNFRDIKFRRATTQPATPAGPNPADWLDGVPAGAEALWMSVAMKDSTGNLIGVWSVPQRLTAFNFRGGYSNTESYGTGDVVTYSERTYVASTTTTGNPPSGSNAGNAWWDLIAGKGDSGDPPTGFNKTIAVPAGQPANLRALADAAGYDGQGDATVTYTVAAGVTLTGNAGEPNGGAAIDTGDWPASATVALTIQNAGTLRGGGGRGGTGGNGFPSGALGAAGGAGGPAITCRTDLTVTNTGIIAGGGGGGGGGNGWFDEGDPFVFGDEDGKGGGGGGGGFPNGSGADGGIGISTSGGAGADGSASGGGAGGSATSLAVAGGAGGGAAAAGSGGGGRGAGGAPGLAVKKNGHAVTVTGGTVIGNVG